MFRDSFAALLIALAACSEPAPEELPLCRLSTASPETSSEADDEEPDPSAPLPNVTARQWTELLVGTSSRAERDCAGEAIRLARVGAGCPADGSTATALPIDES